MAAPKPEREKRKAERLQLLGDLRGEVMVFEPIGIREISHGGIQIESRVALQLDSLHEFRLSLGERSVVVKGRVVHCQISDVDGDVVLYRAGVEFIEASDRVASAIDRFIAAVNEGRRAP